MAHPDTIAKESKRVEQKSRTSFDIGLSCDMVLACSQLLVEGEHASAATL